MAEFSESRFPVGSSARMMAGLVDDGACERDALLLAAGEFERLVVHLVFEFEQAQDFAPAFGVAVRRRRRRA